MNGANELCLECGLCCNGVIFADVKLQPDDDARRLGALGLPVSIPQSGRRNPYFKQPCAALDGCRCWIYAQRPQYCRQFECALLKQVKAGRLETAAALRIIRTAREGAEKVRRLLRAVGDVEEHAALAGRFRRAARRLEETGLDEQTADTYAQLTLAVHDLNLLVSQAFYPGCVEREPRMLSGET